MKTMAEAFGGRSSAYDVALRGGREALVEALARNVYAGKRDATSLADYVEAAAAALAATPLQVFPGRRRPLSRCRRLRPQEPMTWSQP